MTMVIILAMDTNNDDNDDHGRDDNDENDVDADGSVQDVESHHLQLLLSYMYRGQVLTPHDHHHHHRQCQCHDLG